MDAGPASPITVSLEPTVRERAKRVVDLLFAAARGLAHADAPPLSARSFVTLRELEQLCQEQPGKLRCGGCAPGG